MIVQDIIQPEKPGGWVLVRTYSDAGMMIRQYGTGDLYADAVDPQFVNRTYTETEIPIDGGEEDSDSDKAEAYDILIGAHE